MATNFPTSLDALSNPTGSDDVDNATAALKHSNQHININDAMEAVQAKVGADSSAVATSLDYKVNVALPASIAAAGGGGPSPFLLMGA